MNQPAAATPRPDGYIQDRASQMVSEHLAPFAGPVVADVCAAPGGKATALAGAAAGLVVAGDLAAGRALLIAENARRLSLANVVPVIADGQAPPFRRGTVDLALVDAPCSGLGVLRRRPDARWRIRAADVERLARLQQRLLTETAALVRPGGVLAYSVCTLTGAETGRMDQWLRDSHPEFEPLPPPSEPWRPAGRGALLLPQAAGTDGMFLVSLRRRR
jgi:16S rRNA (cytosine967-C5)-methyltransferase